MTSSELMQPLLAPNRDLGPAYSSAESCVLLHAWSRQAHRRNAKEHREEQRKDARCAVGDHGGRSSSRDHQMTVERRVQFWRHAAFMRPRHGSRTAELARHASPVGTCWEEARSYERRCRGSEMKL